MKRRTLLGAAGLGTTLGFTGRLGMTATDSELTTLLALLEEAPREQLPGRLAGLIGNGLTRAELLPALALAVARNVQPYPDVGFKYHAFMVLHATQSIAGNLDGPEAWLPLVWAVDYFKRTQLQERQESGWRQPVREGSGTNSRQVAGDALIDALERWDLEAADAAVVDHVRLAGAEATLSLLLPYGARDLREIGHKAITLQNTHRLLPLFGPGQAEPLLRSAVAALLNPAEDGNPAEGDYAADRPWRAHQSLLGDIPADWRQGGINAGARDALLAELRQVSELEAGAAVAEALRAGVSAPSVWQALFAAGGELVMRRPAVVPVHSVTSVNALHHAYRQSSEPRVQQLMLLQAAAFMPLFRRMAGNANPQLRIDAFEPLALAGSAAEAPEEIMSEVSEDGLRAAGKALRYLEDGGDAELLVARARHYLAQNADETHAYKFAEAAFENQALAADPAWRKRLLAGSMVYLTGSRVAERNPAVEETAQLLGAG